MSRRDSLVAVDLTDEEAELLYRNLPEAPENHGGIDADGGDEEENICNELVDRGFMRTWETPGYGHWETTEIGRAVLRLFRDRTRTK